MLTTYTCDLSRVITHYLKCFRCHLPDHVTQFRGLSDEYWEIKSDQKMSNPFQLDSGGSL